MKRQLQISGAVLLAAVLIPAMAKSADTPQTKDVDVGGYRLHCVVQGTGSPVVVFENGMGEPLDTWKKVQPAIAKSTTTFLYDRGGLGQSQPPPESASRDARGLADELHRLLEAAKVRGPYVLVGHSLGGAVAQVFAHAYPEDVAGLVLVDPEDGRLTRLLQAKLPADVWAARQKILATDSLPPAIKREFDAMGLAASQVARALPLPQVPIVLLTGTKKDPDFPGNPTEQELKLELHKAFVARVPSAEHVLVPESRHYIQDDAPDKVIEAIQSVLAKTQRAPAH